MGEKTHLGGVRVELQQAPAGLPALGNARRRAAEEIRADKKEEQQRTDARCRLLQVLDNWIVATAVDRAADCFLPAPARCTQRA